MEERFVVLLHMMEQSGADFICLQEVTYKFLQMLFAASWVSEQYFVAVQEQTGYFVVILSKWPGRCFEQPFQSRMGRALLIYEVQIMGEPLVVATTHLESLTNAPTRKLQLELSLEILTPFRNMILCGDFNFTSEWRVEQKTLEPTLYSDVWLDLNGGRETFSMSKNLHYPSWRPDKIVVSRVSTWKAREMHRVGAFSIPSFQKDKWTAIEEDSTVRTPSDHMGFIAKFERAALEEADDVPAEVIAAALAEHEDRGHM